MSSCNLSTIKDPVTYERVTDLMHFLDSSPVNFLAAQTICTRLDAAGFTRLPMNKEWVIEPNGRYYVTQNDSAVFAFVAPSSAPRAFRVIAAHSDSPCFRVKPNCEMISDGCMLRLNTEVYGGPILYTWFDRPLSLAGRVILRNEKSTLDPIRVNIDFRRPLMTIAHLAIHFNRAVNDGNPISKQKDMLPVVGRLNSADEAKGWLLRLVANELDIEPERILDFDLSLYDTTKAEIVGAYGDFITSGRIDDLSMAHAAMTTIIETAEKSSEDLRIMAVFDNEETGSGTKQGAGSPILEHIIRRVFLNMGKSEAEYMASIADSFMISADNAHGVHPNYVEKQDPTNHPVLGNGPVIKINANCKYMSDAVTAAIYAEICREAGVPFQYFVNHSDVAGGSTLGNILTSQIPLRGVDMGAAIWAMHSARETASSADVPKIIASFKHFFSL